MNISRSWLGKAALALAWALAMRLLLHRLGLPDSPAGDLAPLIGLDRPGFWWKFLGDWAPLGLLFMSSAGYLLSRWARTDAPRSAARFSSLDWPAYAALPLMLGFTALHAHTPAWPLWCGVAYLAALSWQAALVAAMLWEAGGSPGADGRLLAWGGALLGLALYLGLNFWVAQAVSTCGDESLYLINTDRLMAALGLSSGQAHMPEYRLHFYWGGWSKSLAKPLAESWGLFALLGPGWVLAGRLGALAILALAGALALGLFCRLGLNLGYRERPVLAATWLLGFSLPLLQLTQHVYPGALGVLGVILGLHCCQCIQRRTAPALLLLGLIAIFLALAKMRLAPVSLGLILAGLAALYLHFPLRRRKIVLIGSGLLALLAALLLASLLGAPGLGLVTNKLWSIKGVQLGPMLVSLPAMLFDQQFGLLAYAPWLILGLAGAARFGREHPRQLLYGLIIAGVSVSAVVLWRWVQWEGGFTPPGRFLAPLLPILALWSLPAFARGGRLWRSLCAALGLASLAVAWIFTLIPQWRFHRRTGINNFLAWLDDALSGTAHRFWPSFNEISWQPILPVLPWLLLLAASAYYLWRDPKPAAAQPPAWGLGRLGIAGGALVLAALLTSVVLGRLVPTGYMEAENLRTAESRLYGNYYNRRVQLVLRSPADHGQTMVVAGRDIEFLEVRAHRVADRTQAGPPPVIAFYMDDKPLGQILVVKTAWRIYRLPISVSPGRHLLQVRMLSHSGRDAVGLDWLRLGP
ncbi:hypothetical protein [Desulfoferula mesophila]